jgi:hypothetical protein
MTSLEAAQRNYSENIKNIPWNNDIARNFDSASQSSNNRINSQLPIFMNNVEQQARNVTGAAAQRNAARSAVDGAINALKNVPLGIDSRIGMIDIGGIQTKINGVEQQIAAEKAKQSKSNELLELRKEQTAVLEKKYSANLHSSWLGLWRPLKDNTHVGLNVASVMFGILALLAIGYLGYMYYTSAAPAAAPAGGNAGIAGLINAGAKNFMQNLTGGFRKVKLTHS